MSEILLSSKFCTRNDTSNLNVLSFRETNKLSLQGATVAYGSVIYWFGLFCFVRCFRFHF